ncbi:MAG: class II aldolase/adducin family protein [bacterium]
MEEIDKFRKEISEIGKRLYNKGFAAGTSGNISIKYGKQILITPSGYNLADVNDKDIVILDIEGNNIENNKKPSSEKMMHLEIYKSRNDINSIIHAHPPKSTTFAVAGIPLDSPILSEAFVVLGSVPIIEYAAPSSNKLASLVANYFLRHDAVLLANHGVVIGGKNLTDTYYKLETLELYAEISIWTKLLGKTNELSQNDIQELLKIKENMMIK